eukprot:CAMPEP_0178897290 /NCGR_PEP_ID=MMETSP0786-20121207/1661_1 /TAXON_ID=186022 /ORGANISM="Thalassionema frauenfeldii, Strain CCMP 1798" /LENGTH=306 /DNA_ID=CAMNT_0020567817 /DNA_START=136 /DNA_END=1058 /DNA_ORIENTATION=+
MSSLPLVVSFCASKFTSTAKDDNTTTFLDSGHHHTSPPQASLDYTTAIVHPRHFGEPAKVVVGVLTYPMSNESVGVNQRNGSGQAAVAYTSSESRGTIRFLYDQARQKGFLEVAGSAWRSQRRDAPLLNTYRSLCDARGKVCIVLHKSNTGVEDEVVVDLSPLRFPEDFDRIESILHEDDKIPSLDNSDENDSTSREIQQLLKPYAEHVLALNRDIEDEEESTWITEDGESSKVSNDVDQWENRPIYQLPPYYVSWGRLQRSNAKTLSKLLSVAFNVPDPKAAKKSLKPKGVKAGKSRRSGGYGIG